MLIVKEAFYLKSRMRVSMSFLGLPWQVITTMWLTTLAKCSLTVLEPGLLHQGVSSTMLPGKPGRTLPGLFLVSGGFQQSLVFLDLYRYTCFSKVHFMPLHCYERSILVPVFTNWKKSEEKFCFYPKKMKSENSVQHCSCKEIKPVNPKGNQSWIFTGRTDAEAEAPVLWPPNSKRWLLGKDSDAGKDWAQE